MSKQCENHRYLHDILPCPVAGCENGHDRPAYVAMHLSGGRPCKIRSWHRMLENGRWGWYELPYTKDDTPYVMAGAEEWLRPKCEL